jgi:membrane-associated protein
MDLIRKFVDLFLHLDKHLQELSAEYGVWLYAILFIVIFCETGLVVTPFLPGDSLLFAVGALAATGGLDPHLMTVLLSIAAIAGNTANYAIGYHLGPRVFHEQSRFFRKEYLDRTHAFYDKHGGKTIIIARFLPIIRTFAPFVAGIGRMSYTRFMTYNVIAGIVWVAFFIYIGYFFGNMPFVKRNFSIVILAIIIVSMLPGIIEYLRHRREKKKNSA